MSKLASSLAITRRLVAFPTVSSESNFGLITFIRDYLSSFGIESRLTYNTDRGKANLFATIGAGNGGVVLSGHTDVVPASGGAWTSDPFLATERGDRLYGRGTADMKGFIAAVLHAVPKFLDTKLREPVHLAFSYDEEIGCLGARQLIAGMLADGIKPRAAIIGEPTSMNVVNAHKGCAGYRITVKGVEAHSSEPKRGVNAIAWMARIVAMIEQLALEAESRCRPDSGFVPPYTTFNSGIISGGSAANVVPGTATLTWGMRLVSWDSERAILETLQDRIEREIRREIKALNPLADVEIEADISIPPLGGSSLSEAERLVHSVLGTSAVSTAAFATEAGLFEQANVPAVVCGPGSIEQAHQRDEYIELSELAAIDRFLEKLTTLLGE
jgi:acetylornithine deacetylase